MSGISTHVLDTAAGRPAAGVQVQLERFGAATSGFAFASGSLWQSVAEGVTDADGRCRPVLMAEKVQPGIYRFTFVTGPYFKALRQSTLYPEVTITFTVAVGERDYHIPLLVSPFGYSTYRGS